MPKTRNCLLRDDLRNDTNFKAKLVIGLLTTSIADYEEGVKNGQIEMMAEFQDDSTFVWRTQQVFEEIRADLPEHEADEIASQVDTILEKLETAEGLLPMEEHEEEHEEEHDVMAPLKQVESGVAPEEVECSGEMELIMKKSTGSPACVTSTAAERLVQLGWGTRPQ